MKSVFFVAVSIFAALNIHAQKIGLSPVDITKQVLKDTQMPFARSTVAFSNSWHAAVWIVNDAVRPNGAVSRTRGDALGTMVSSAMPNKEIMNGKLHQTVKLEAGTYRFSATVYSAQNLTQAYVVAAPGNELPDTDDVEQTALGYAALPATKIAVDTNPVFSVDFTLSEETTVSLGFVATLPSGANRQMFFREVKLEALREGTVKKKKK